MTVPCHADVLFLIVQYLQAMGLYSSSLVLQQESGVDVTWLRGVSHELALLRRWVFAGDVKRARALLKPLQSLDVVPNELVDARLALDELDVLLMKPQRDQDQSRLAQAKLKCFEKLVLLFRAPVGETESNVFKYVAMPKLQLVGLVRDAVLFHCQNSNATAKDCISVKCTVNGIDVVEVENMASLLFLDKPGGKNEHVPISSKPLTQSVDWSNKLHRRPHNPMAQSVSLSQTRWQEDNGEMEAMHNSHEGTESVKTKETADAAVGTEIMVADVAVGSEIMVADVAVGSEIKTIDASVGSEIETASVAVGSKVATADVAVDCVPEAVDIAVSCEPENGNEATTQTDLIALNQAEPEVHTVLKDLKDVDREDNQLQAPTKIDDTGGGNEEAGLGKQDNVPTQSDGSQQEHIMKDQEQVATASNTSGQRQETTIKETSALDQTAAVGISTSSSGNSVVQQTLKTSQKPVVSEPEILENPSKTTQLEQQDDIVRDIETPDQTGSGLLAEVLHVDNDASVGEKIPLHKSAPKHYSELMLDDIVSASVVAEVKEPQAVRALDIHPSGNQLVVGTNARALRIFVVPSPSEQHQRQLSWSPSLHPLLPLLPVSLERHKHHASGIYCVSFNRYLPRDTGAPTMVASGAADGSVKVLISGGKDEVKPHQVEEHWISGTNNSMGKIRALEFASSHHLWVTSTNDRRLRCWDVRRAQRSSSFGPVQSLDGHVGEVQAIAIPEPSISRSTSSFLLSSALDKTIRLWDARSGRCQRLLTSGEHPAFSLHFHPQDEGLIASGHQDGSVSLWDLRATAREALQVVVPHQGECRSVRWSPGGRWLLSASFDGTLSIMQATPSTSALVSSLHPVTSYHQHYGKVLQAQWHPTEPAFVSTGADKRVKLWAFA